MEPSEYLGKRSSRSVSQTCSPSPQINKRTLKGKAKVVEAFEEMEELEFSPQDLSPPHTLPSVKLDFQKNKQAFESNKKAKTSSILMANHSAHSKHTSASSPDKLHL